MLIDDIKAVIRENFIRNNPVSEPSDELIEEYREQIAQLNARIEALRLEIKTIEENASKEENLPIQQETFFSKLFSSIKKLPFFQSKNKVEPVKSPEELKEELENQLNEVLSERGKLRELLELEKTKQNELKSEKSQFEQELSRINRAQTLKAFDIKNLFYVRKLLQRSITLREQDKEFAKKIKDLPASQSEEEIFLISGIKNIKESGEIELFEKHHITTLRRTLKFSSENEDRSFSMNSEKNVLPTDKYAVMIPLSSVPNESVEALMSDGSIILNSDFVLPRNTIFLAPVAERVKIVEANTNNDTTRRAMIVGYMGGSVKGYASTLLKLLGYPEENVISVGNREGRFEEWREKRKNYFSKSAVNDFVEICDSIFFNENIKSLESIDEYIDRIEINGKYKNFRELADDAFSLQNESARIPAYEYMKKEFETRGYTISENANRIMRLLLQGKLAVATQKNESWKLNPNTQETFKRNITDYEKSLLSEKSLILKTFMQMMLTESGLLEYKEEKSKFSEKYHEENDEEDVKIQTVNKRKNKKKENIETKNITKRVDYRLYDDEYEEIFNSLYDRIREISLSTKNTIRINYALKEAMELYDTAKKEWKECYENSRKTGGIFYKGMNIPIRPQLSEAFKSSYKRKGENRIVTSARLLHLENRLAHTFDTQLTDAIKETFGIQDNKEDVRVEETKEFKNLKNQIELLTLIENNSNSSMEQAKYVSKKNDIDEILELDFGIKMNEKQFTKIDEISRQLVNFRNKSFEGKNTLVEFVIKNMKTANEKKAGTYSYGLKENETGSFFVADIPEYEQIIVHIIDPHILSNLVDYADEYGLGLILNEGKPSILVSGISNELKSKIAKKSEEELISDLQSNLSTEDLHKTLVRMGYSGKKLEDALKPKNDGSER